MRSDEMLTLKEFLQLLRKQKEVALRMLLTRETESWTLYQTTLTVAPDVSPPLWSCYDYGPIAFFAKRIEGDEIAEWLSSREGEIEGHRFNIPELNEQVQSERLPSHARYRGFNGPRQPHSKYELHFKRGSPEYSNKRDPLVADECPSFPTPGVAAFKLLFDLDAERDSFPNDGIILRVAHTEAWLDGVELGPNSVRVTVDGDDISGTRIELTGSNDIRFDQRLNETGSFEFPFPNGLPPKLWLLLSRANRWLDLRDLNQYGTTSPWEDVIRTPPDLATQVAGVIARGEGEQTEFKETVPPQDERMLKTIAAFANGFGGMIIIGVVNGTGEIRGLSCDIGREKDRIRQMIRSKIHPEPKTEVEHCEIDGKNLIAVSVAGGQDGPYGVGADPSNLAFHVRRGATTPPARQSEIRGAARKDVNGQSDTSNRWFS